MITKKFSLTSLGLLLDLSHKNVLNPWFFLTKIQRFLFLNVSFKAIFIAAIICTKIFRRKRDFLFNLSPNLIQKPTVWSVSTINGNQEIYDGGSFTAQPQ